MLIVDDKPLSQQMLSVGDLHAGLDSEMSQLTHLNLRCLRLASLVLPWLIIDFSSSAAQYYLLAKYAASSCVATARCVVFLIKLMDDTEGSSEPF